MGAGLANTVLSSPTPLGPKMSKTKPKSKNRENHERPKQDD
jgi:hypothetical protein